MTQTLFIFGLGYSAGLLAQQALQKGWRVLATTRKPEDLTLTDGIERFLFDGTTPLDHMSEKLESVTHIVHSIPPHPETGDAVFQHHHADLEKLPNLEWFGYLSTTGVYGTANGQEVTEDSPLNPTSQRAKARKETEENWLKTTLPVHLFRLAGIYGPERNSFQQIKAGKARAILKKGHKFSRIHQEDIVGILWASIAKPNPKSAYNVCDNYPCEALDVLSYAYHLLGQPAPEAIPFEDVQPTLSPMAQSFWKDNKIVSNQKVKTELTYAFHYPTYKEGLQAIFKTHKAR